MVKKLIQACAVLILVTAVIYGNKPIQQPQHALSGAFPQGPYRTTSGGGGGFGGAFRNV